MACDAQYTPSPLCTPSGNLLSQSLQQCTPAKSAKRWMIDRLSRSIQFGKIAALRLCTCICDFGHAQIARHMKCSMNTRKQHENLIKLWTTKHGITWALPVDCNKINTSYDKCKLYYQLSFVIETTSNVCKLYY